MERGEHAEEACTCPRESLPAIQSQVIPAAWRNASSEQASSGNTHQYKDMKWCLNKYSHTNKTGTPTSNTQKKKSCTLQILQSWPKLSHRCSHFRFSQRMGKWRPGHWLPGVSHLLLRSNKGDQWPVSETMTYLASALSRVTAPSVAALPWGEGKQQSVWKLPFAQVAVAHLAETTEPEEQKNES